MQHEDQRPAMQGSSSQDCDIAVQAARFTRLWTQSARRVYSYILTLLPDPNDAEEVFQEVSATLWEKFSEFEQGTSFPAWACRVAYFKILQFHQQRRRHPATLGAATLEILDRVTTSHAQELDARYLSLAQCVSQLNARDRDLIARRYAEGSSAQQVANQVGRSVDAVYKALQRIHSRLLHCVSRRRTDGDR